MSEPTVLVIGGGIVGAAIAERLAREGISVTVIDRRVIGGEASWAAAGLLVPVHPWRYPAEMLELDDESFTLWVDLAQRIRAETAIDVELRRSGLLSLIETREDDDHAARRTEWTRGRRRHCERVAAAAIRDRLPFLRVPEGGGLWMEDVAQIRNPRATPGLMAAAKKRGATFIEYRDALSLIEEGGRVVGASVRRGHPQMTTVADLRASGTIDEMRADFVVLAAGAWSGAVLGDRCPPALRTSPCRGQIMMFRIPPAPPMPIVLASGDYLVPRSDNLVLAGSTLEPGETSAHVTPAGLAQIGGFVARVAPGFAGLPVERTWAGLRPDTPDHLPCIGPVPGFDGLIAATGHYRSGIMLAPVTAEIVFELVRNDCTRDLRPFAPGRVVASSAPTA